MVSISDFKTEEEKLKALNFYVEAIKKQKYGTYKAIAERFNISERQLRRIRKGTAKVNMKLLKSVKRSFEAFKKHQYMGVAIVGQSGLVTGVIIYTLTELAIQNALKRLVDSQNTERVYFVEYYHLGIKNESFELKHLNAIIGIIEDIEDNEGLIFLDKLGFIEELASKLNASDRKKASIMIADMVV
ncbi:MAG: hypothetical protein WC149_08675 [Arcobacteraceae bacterium]